MQTRLRLSEVLLTALLGLFLTRTAFRQRGTGAVTGTLTDPTGAVVPSPMAKLINSRTGVQETADNNAAGFIGSTLSSLERAICAIY